MKCSFQAKTSQLAVLLAFFCGLVFGRSDSLHAVLIDGDFGTAGTVSIIDNNNYTSAQAGNWGTNTGGAWDVVSGNGNPPDAARFTLPNDNIRVLIQATQDSFQSTDDGELRFDVLFQENSGSNMVFEYDVHGWDGAGTWVNNSFATIPASAQLLTFGTVDVAGQTSAGWETIVDPTIDFGSGFDFLVVRFNGGNANSDLLAVDNVLLQTVGPPIPEPSSLALLLGAAALVGSRVRRTFKHDRNKLSRRS